MRSPTDREGSDKGEPSRVFALFVIAFLVRGYARGRV